MSRSFSCLSLLHCAKNTAGWRRGISLCLTSNKFLQRKCHVETVKRCQENVVFWSPLLRGFPLLSTCRGCERSITISPHFVFRNIQFLVGGDWNMPFIFPFSWEFHDPNWLYCFSEGLKLYSNKNTRWLRLRSLRSGAIEAPWAEALRKRLDPKQSRQAGAAFLMAGGNHEKPKEIRFGMSNHRWYQWYLKS